jgi:predicted GNAT family acetyltransferase
VFNSFQQLIYQGPKFRAFQLPFNMKPTSYAEATTMRDIIQTFRIASSPRGRGFDTKLTKTVGKSAEEEKAFEDANKNKADDDKIIEFSIDNADKLFASDASTSAPLTFGYPDMCKLELILYHNNDGAKMITPVFKSDFCMIENVVLDYGASNKMVFLSNPEAAEAGDYFPSEISMTISLRESVLVTAEYASGQNGPGITIF